MSGLRTHRFGFVGTGAMAATMAACFAQSPRVAVAAVVSHDLDRARAFARRFRLVDEARAAHADLASMLARDDLDAVYIANGTADHASAAIAALAAGKAVLCEKPFALTEAQGREVAAAASASGKLFMEAQWTPFLPAFVELRRLVASGALGESLHLRSEFGQSLDAASHPRLFEGPGAGVLLDFGVYPITMALQLLGPAASVQAALVHSAHGVDVRAALQIEHAGGGQSQLAATLQSALSNTSVLAGSRGRVELVSPVMGAESLRSVFAPPHAANAHLAHAGGTAQRLVAALRRQPWVRRLKAAKTVGASSAHSYGADRYLPQLLHFVGLLDSSARASDVMPIDASLDVLRVIDAARAASPVPARP